MIFDSRDKISAVILRFLRINKRHGLLIALERVKQLLVKTD